MDKKGKKERIRGTGERQREENKLMKWFPPPSKPTARSFHLTLNRDGGELMEFLKLKIYIKRKETAGGEGGEEDTL